MKNIFVNNSILTIALVSYNNPQDVEKTLSSLLHLQKVNFEILLVDSSDNRLIHDLFNKYAQLLKIRYFFQEPNGVYSAMNLAIDEAETGSYIWFLNPGDALYNSLSLQKLLVYLDDSNLNWGFGQAKNEKPQDHLIYPVNVPTLTPESVALGQVQISHQAILVKTQKLIDLGKFNEKYKIASDLEMIIKLSNFEYYFLDEILVSIDLNGLSRKKPIRTIIETNYIVYKSSHRSFFASVYNLFKSLVSLQFGAMTIQIVRIVKKLGYTKNAK
jgi:glycosyltransferase involved in cell wall biosynthesis